MFFSSSFNKKQQNHTLSLKCLNNMEVKHRIFIPNIDTKTESEGANHWRVQSLTIWKFREQNMWGKDNITLKFSDFPPNISKLTFRLVFLFPLRTFPPNSHKFAIISITKNATLARGSRIGCSMTLPFGASTGRWNRRSTWLRGTHSGELASYPEMCKCRVTLLEASAVSFPF